VAVVFVGTGAAPEVAAAPVPEGPEVRAGGIWLPETFRTMAEVRSEPALREAIAPTLEVIGNAAVNQEHVAAVGTRAEGIVRRVEHVEGDLVRAGDALASIESTELGEAEAGIAAVAARVAAAREELPP
jgi:cobalt-zinc-cadmium efflux system membrane fusion protein